MSSNIERKREFKKVKNTFAKFIKSFEPPIEMDLVKWADEYRYLSPEASAEPGRWRTDRAPYQREIMNAISDPKCEFVVVMSSAQVGKTEIILNTIGYFIDYEPSPLFIVQPTDKIVERFSKDRLAPMIRDCPTLSSKVRDAKSRSSGNTITKKQFKGGQITIVGANSGADLSGSPIRIVLLDEVDRYPASAGTEGDPAFLAIKRTNNFWNKKILMVSTPTIKGKSKIEKEFEDSSMEEVCLACPQCGEYQPLVWSNIKFDHESGTKDFKLHGHVCDSCGCVSGELEWKRQPLKWIAKNPDEKKKRGFHLNELISPWKTWDEVVSDFLEAKRKGKEELKVWTNTSLGESWEEEVEIDLNNLLEKRREYYNCVVPKDVIILTCGIDVQDNRLEYEIVGWGLGKQSWGIKYGVLMGDPRKKDVWEALDNVLFANYKRADGLEMQIVTTCIDSGGHCTTDVYLYCRKHENKKVWAIKGKGGAGVPFIIRPKKRNDNRVWLFSIGVDYGKGLIVANLNENEPTEPGFCHFPYEADKGYDDQYFIGLTSERKVKKYVKGKEIVTWEKVRSSARNEPFDCRNYATAAFSIANPNLEMIKKAQDEGQNSINNTQITNNQPQKRVKKASKGVEIW